MKVSTHVVGPFQENSYLLVDEPMSTGVLIDPGDEAERLIAAVSDAQVQLAAIWLTHAHLDHIGAIAGVKRRWDVPVFLHPLDEPLYRAGARQAAHYGLPFDPPPPADRELAEGDVLRIGSLEFTVMHAPGHAPGHVVIHGHGIMFAGDCLFAGSIGRTDLPLSNASDLAATLERIATLPVDSVVYPGHGPPTTIGTEVRENPFLNGMVRIVG